MKVMLFGAGGLFLALSILCGLYGVVVIVDKASYEKELRDQGFWERELKKYGGLDQFEEAALQEKRNQIIGAFIGAGAFGAVAGGLGFSGSKLKSK